ncbi:MAG: methylamine utilization protein [Methylococcales bacterium]|nr:methylamine utilization protein [Methylococcales bacterium]
MQNQNKLFFLVLLVFSVNVSALTLSGTVTTTEGEPVFEAVITAVGTVKNKPVLSKAPRKMDQRHREFVSHILAIHVGESVVFPNSDNIQHHIYSFSPTNSFEIQLYKDIVPKPIVFDKSGVVVLGCNIHDWMVGYVYVTDAPYFTQTDAKGAWSLNLPADDYTLTLWYPHLDSTNNVQVQQIKLNTENPASIEQKVTLKTTARTGKPPAEDSQNPLY